VRIESVAIKSLQFGTEESGIFFPHRTIVFVLQFTGHDAVGSALLFCVRMCGGDSLTSMKTSVAIYPGTFDPVTNGHLDLIGRGERMFDRVIVAVLKNAEKQPLFTVPERVEMLREVTKEWESVEVDVFDGLLVDYARKRGAGVILRGIRAISDYEYELQMALMNRKLEPRLETVFMLPGESYSYLSAKLVKELAHLGGPLTGLVPPIVEQRLRSKIV
jgi:pantetheine-phosphate adenylyltransferase